MESLTSLIWKSDIKLPGTRLVLLALADESTNGHCFKSGYEIAEKCGTHWGSTYKNLTILIKEGLVDRIATGAKPKYVYRVRRDKLLMRQRGMLLTSPSDSSQ